MTLPSDSPALGTAESAKERRARPVGVAVPAAGIGRRMGGRGKTFVELAGRPLLERTLLPFLDYPETIAVTVALSDSVLGAPPTWLTELDDRVRLVRGGATRFDSVLAALEALPEQVEIAIVHDAARPLVTREIVDRCVIDVGRGRGVVAGWPTVDTLKIVYEGRRVLKTPDRSVYWRAQTPQAFIRAEILDAYHAADRESGSSNTDDAEVYARAGGEVVMVEGSAWNLKVTHPEDLRVAALLLECHVRASDAG